MAERSATLIGRRIGAYRLLSFLGAGGMGEYRARDDKPGRDVAIKVLSVEAVAYRRQQRAVR